jgi:hypothetical protein
MNRTCLAAAIAFAAGPLACADPRLTLDFVIKEPYLSAIQSVDLQVLVPPIAAPFNCDDVAFGRVDAKTLTLTRVGETSSDTQRTALNDINRTANKIFIADGFDETKRRLVTGCVALGEIKKDTSIRIIAEPVARVSPAQPASISTVLDRPLTTPILIPVKDVLDKPLAGVHAVWNIEGAAGLASTGEANTDPTGVLSLSPALPSRPGPFVLDVRVKWADNPPVVVPGFVRPNPIDIDLPSRALQYASGAIGPSMEKGVVVMLAEPGGNRLALVYKRPDAPPDAPNHGIVVKTSARLPAPSILGVIDERGRRPDRVIAVGLTSWSEVVDPNGMLETRMYAPPSGTTQPVKIFTTGSCTGDAPEDDPQVLIEYAESVAAIFPADGGDSKQAFRLSRDPTMPATILASGCLSDQSARLSRTWAVDLGSGFGVVLLLPTVDFPAAFWLTLPQALAFSPAIGTSDKRLIFGTQISVNDIVVSRASFQHEMDMLSVVVEGFDTVPSVPSFTAVGDLDGDGGADAASLFRRAGATMNDPPKDAIWTVLARQHETRRISGDADLGTPLLRAPMLVLADVDGDGSDDIVVGETTTAVGDANAHVYIYQMGH